MVYRLKYGDNLNMNHDLSWIEYLTQVATAAKELGYTMNQVSMFQQDIYEAWLDGHSVEDCVKTEF